MTEKYKIEFKKPPKGTQFQPGKSGNPKGRPKGSLNVSTDLARELSERVTVRENGRTHSVSKQKAMIKALIAKAMGGDVRATSTALELAAKFESDETASEMPRVDRDELLILQRFAPRAVERVRARQKKKSK